MPEIVLVGANGQVASEVALHLADEPDVRVVGLVRSPYSAALFRLLGLEWHVIDYADSEGLRRRLARADLAVDFTYPQVQLPQILPTIRRNTGAILAALPPGSRYLLASSIMAWGTPDGGQIRHHAIPYSSYAYIKRMAERLTLELGQARGLETFRFRLGQVHGELQAVTLEYRERLSQPEAIAEGGPSDLSTTVFASSVARALTKVARGEVRSGLYTLVSSPQWTLQELYDYYAKCYGAGASVCYRPPASGGLLRTVLGSLNPTQRARAWAEINLFIGHARFFAQSKGIYRTRSVAVDLSTLRSDSTTPTKHLVGTIPGPTLSDIGSEPALVLAAQQRVAVRLERCLAQGRQTYEL